MMLSCILYCVHSLYMSFAHVRFYDRD